MAMRVLVLASLLALSASEDGFRPILQQPVAQDRDDFGGHHHSHDHGSSADSTSGYTSPSQDFQPATFHDDDTQFSNIEPTYIDDGVIDGGIIDGGYVDDQFSQQQGRVVSGGQQQQLAVQQPATSFAVQQPATSFAVQQPATSFAVQQPATSFAVQQPATSYQPQVFTGVQQSAAQQPLLQQAGYQQHGGVQQVSLQQAGYQQHGGVQQVALQPASYQQPAAQLATVQYPAAGYGSGSYVADSSYHSYDDTVDDPWYMDYVNLIKFPIFWPKFNFVKVDRDILNYIPDPTRDLGGGKGGNGGKKGGGVKGFFKGLFDHGKGKNTVVHHHHYDHGYGGKGYGGKGHGGKGFFGKGKGGGGYGHGSGGYIASPVAQPVYAAAAPSYAASYAHVAAPAASVYRR